MRNENKFSCVIYMKLYMSTIILSIVGYHCNTKNMPCPMWAHLERFDNCCTIYYIKCLLNNLTKLIIFPQTKHIVSRRRGYPRYSYPAPEVGWGGDIPDTGSGGTPSPLTGLTGVLPSPLAAGLNGVPPPLAYRSDWGNTPPPTPRKGPGTTGNPIVDKQTEIITFPRTSYNEKMSKICIPYASATTRHRLKQLCNVVTKYVTINYHNKMLQQMRVN